MDERATPPGFPRLTRATPWPVWLLLAAAVVQLGIQIAPDSYQVFGPYFLVSGEMVIDWIRSAAPFVLAAVVVLAADRWPAGRRQLLIGAAAMATASVLQMSLDGWWAIWNTNPGPLPDGQPWLSLASFGAALGMLAAHLFLAAGLWAARGQRRVGRPRMTLIVLIGLAGAVATGAGLWVVRLAWDSIGSVDHFWVGVVGATLTAAGFAALAAVAVAAAARTAQRTDWMPEILIATGAIVEVVATSWTWSFPHFVPGQSWSDGTSVWVYTIPNAAAAVGTLAMIAGFGLGAMAARRSRAGVDPSA